MKKNIIGFSVLAVIAVLVNQILIWVSLDDPKYYLKIGIEILIILIAASSFILRLIKIRKDSKENAPAEDEFTDHAKLIAGNHAFHYSLALWFLIFIFNHNFSDNYEMLGIGILGSAAIYGLLLWYYKSTGDFLDEK